MRHADTLPAPPPTPGDLTILVLGDPHGYWRLAAALVRGYYDATGRWPDAVLCTGDMGYFPTPESVDKATRKHALKEPEQTAGLTRLLEGADPVLDALLTDGAPPFVCVGGNHEAHPVLAAWVKAHPTSRPLVALDPLGRVVVLRDGDVSTVTGADGVTCRVGGLWGIEPSAARVDRRTPGKHIDPAAVRALHGRAFDLLLTHDGPVSDQVIAGQTVGSLDIANLLMQRPHALGLFGHYHFRDGRRLVVGNAVAVQMGILRPGVPAMAALVTGIPGRWDLTWWHDLPEWRGAAEARINALPWTAGAPPAPETVVDSEPDRAPGT
jgi:hypothetical protein